MLTANFIFVANAKNITAKFDSGECLLPFEECSFSQDFIYDAFNFFRSWKNEPSISLWIIEKKS